MENFPSKLALVLAKKRVKQGSTTRLETMTEAIEAAVSIAINYDGAAIVNAIGSMSHLFVHGQLSESKCQEIWDEINGKHKPKSS